ncbi:hypothetical protein DL765_008036 [Monosporascus sp. GIB2]|nr:hypothetical protein DL765_008036 [Monosporascus sp. GIB2]
MKITLLPVGIVSVLFLLGCITSISAFSDLRSPLHSRRDIADDESAQKINYEDYGGPVPQNLEYDYPTSYGAYGPPFSPPPPVVTPPSSASSTSSSASGSPSSGAGSGSPSSSSVAANSGHHSHGLRNRRDFSRQLSILRLFRNGLPIYWIKCLGVFCGDHRL